MSVALPSGLARTLIMDCGQTQKPVLSHRRGNEEWDLMAKRLDCIWVVGPVVQRLGALAQSTARYPHITPGEDFKGYSEGLRAGQ